MLLKPIDIAFWLAAVLGLAAMYVGLWQPATQAAQLQVMVDNQLQHTVNLLDNQQLAVRGVLGESQLEIKNGQVRFISSPCRNQVCVHHGWASHRGELLACLPNRIALVLAGEATQPSDIDAVNF